MFSSKHKNTAFFSPLNQFSDVCQMALKAIPGLNKAFRNFLTNTLLMFALLPRKVNFTQLEIYGNYCEKTYRSGFSKHFDWVGFNLELSNRLWGAGGRKAIAIDPSYISKSGKHTQGIGRFWSGCAQQVKHGLEILGIGLIDIDKKDCLSLKAVQTPSPKSLADCGVSLVRWYLTCILTLRDRLVQVSRYIVADAYFSVSDFANGLEENGFHLVSRFRSDAALLYLYNGERTGKKGRPKTYDGKINFRELDSEVTRIPIGTLSGNYLLSGKGPGLKLRICPAEEVTVRLESEFTSAGMNQTTHRISAIITAEVSSSMPIYSFSTKVEFEFLIAETVIIGEVPALSRYAWSSLDGQAL